jgi:hypothetical protein
MWLCEIWRTEKHEQPRSTEAGTMRIVPASVSVSSEDFWRYYAYAGP